MDDRCKDRSTKLFRKELPLGLIRERHRCGPLNPILTGSRRWSDDGRRGPSRLKEGTDERTGKTRGTYDRDEGDTWTRLKRTHDGPTGNGTRLVYDLLGKCNWILPLRV